MSDTQRKLFGRQPARMVLIDLVPPFNMDICHNLRQALEHIVSLASSLTGPPRLAFFGIMALGSYPETILPLQATKGAYNRIFSALQELQAICGDLAGHTTSSCLTQAVVEATQSFKNHCSAVMVSGGYLTELEITVFTCQNTAARQVDRALKNCSDNVKKVQVIHLGSSEVLSEDVSSISSGSQNSHSSESSRDEATSLVDVLNLSSDVLSIEEYFKMWLHDAATDREHLHLVINNNGAGDGLVLKCDLHERVVDPSLLPISNFNLLSLGQSHKMAYKSGADVPVYRMKAIRTVPIAAICDSLVYGTPLVVKATGCWKIDWDELEANQRRFVAFANLMAEKQDALICQMDVTEKLHVNRKGFKYQIETPTANGLFVVMPSKGCSMLIRPITGRELALPCDISPSEENLSTPPDILEEVTNAYSQVEHADSYNPLLYCCNVYDRLNHQLNKACPGNKRKATESLQPAAVPPPPPMSQANMASGFVSAGSTQLRNPSLTMSARGATGMGRNQKGAGRSKASAFYVKGQDSPFPTQL